MKTEQVMSLLKAIQEDINNGDLVLPTLPDVAHKIHAVIDKNDVSSDVIANIIATDIATASRLIRVANSPLYASNKKVNSVKTAVQRLGNLKTYQLVKSFLIQQLFQSDNPCQAQKLKAIWQHSVNVASMCRAFTMFASHLDADEAMLAGLTHQIGMLPILKYFSGLPVNRYDQSTLDCVIEMAHSTLGHLVLKAWDFPNELVMVPLEYTQFARQHNHPADYVDIVQVAFLQAVAGSHHPAAVSDWTQVQAFAKLGFQFDQTLLAEHDIAMQIDWVKSILND